MVKTLKPSRRMILRLCRYQNHLLRIQQFGAETCFSEDIAEALQLTSAQIRKDFSVFNISGRRKAGYRIAALLSSFNKILSRLKIREAIVVGTNPLAMALMQEPFFASNQIHLAACFGDPSGIAKCRETGIPVMPFKNLNNFAREHKIEYAILAITEKHAAQRALDLLVLYGIKNILSLAPVELSVPASCWVHSVNLAAEFDNLVFFAGKKARNKGAAVA